MTQYPSGQRAGAHPPNSANNKSKNSADESEEADQPVEQLSRRELRKNKKKVSEGSQNVTKEPKVSRRKPKKGSSRCADSSSDGEPEQPALASRPQTARLVGTAAEARGCRSLLEELPSEVIIETLVAALPLHWFGVCSSASRKSRQTFMHPAVWSALFTHHFGTALVLHPTDAATAGRCSYAASRVHRAAAISLAALCAKVVAAGDTPQDHVRSMYEAVRWSRCLKTALYDAHELAADTALLPAGTTGGGGGGRAAVSFSLLHGHTRRITAFCADEEVGWITTCCEDGKICVWSANSGQQLGRSGVKCHLTHADMCCHPRLATSQPLTRAVPCRFGKWLVLSDINARIHLFELQQKGKTVALHRVVSPLQLDSVICSVQLVQAACDEQSALVAIVSGATVHLLDSTGDSCEAEPPDHNPLAEQSHREQQAESPVASSTAGASDDAPRSQHTVRFAPSIECQAWQPQTAAAGTLAGEYRVWQEEAPSAGTQNEMAEQPTTDFTDFFSTTAAPEVDSVASGLQRLWLQAKSNESSAGSSARAVMDCSGGRSNCQLTVLAKLRGAGVLCEAPRGDELLSTGGEMLVACDSFGRMIWEFTLVTSRPPICLVGQKFVLICLDSKAIAYHVAERDSHVQLQKQSKDVKKSKKKKPKVFAKKTGGRSFNISFG